MYIFTYLYTVCTYQYAYRDMKKPITVLTGLDYWLDNLMCNVPELAMCFHLDGIVQVSCVRYYMYACIYY